MNQDFRDLLHALSDAEARYLIVGAYALAVHGHPRATGDLDVWVQATSDNAQKVYKALTVFGAPLAELTIEDLASGTIVFQMGVPPRRIDILTSVSGVTFEDAWPRRATAQFGDVQATVIGMEDMLVNKRASGRPKDLLDADILQRLIAGVD